MRRLIIFIYISLLLSIVLFSYEKNENLLPNKIMNYYVSNFYKDTGAQNVVSAIYLNYRVYDTLFEAFMLLISIIGIIYFSRHEGENHNEK